ncbi:hypothetical protein HWV62_3931 [Athelia sp. TMB]|nr:hypothetical protein HWV62_3931 [Athelia sp. TMB]
MKRRFNASRADVQRLQALKGGNKSQRSRNAMQALQSQIAMSSSSAIPQTNAAVNEEDIEMADAETPQEFTQDPMRSAVPEEDTRPVHQLIAEPELESNLSIAARRPRRQVHLPARFIDFVPHPLTDEVNRAASPPPSPSVPSSVSASVTTLDVIPTSIPPHVDTVQNMYGLYRRFTGNKLPEHDPERTVDLAALTDGGLKPGSDGDSEKSAGAGRQAAAFFNTPRPPGVSFYPFENENAFRIAELHYSDNASTSQKKFKDLRDIIGAPTFKPEDIRNTNWTKIHRILGHNVFDCDESQRDEKFEWEDVDAGWKKSPISIQVPFHRKTFSPGVRTFAVGDLYHRSLVDIIREKLANPVDDAQFHYAPYELHWRPRADGAPSTRVHGEFYTSPEFFTAHEKLQAAENEPGCSLEKVVLAMEFASDSTQLTHFGSAKLWPLPDSFSDFVAQHNAGKGLSRRHMTHCRRELFHAQWEVLLDDEFIEAYLHGIVVVCCDGIARRFYPRFFIYCADYPEKVLIASIRDKGQCPCPRCTMSILEVANLGTPEDAVRRAGLIRLDDEEFRRTIRAARELILNYNHAVDSKDVEDLLKDKSLTPTANAFSKKLGPLGFNVFRALLADFMHEVEIGVWKGLFIHLLRILEAHDKKTKTTMKEFNKRFRMVPSFGRATIRRFVNDVSALKQLAARDYEDILQLRMHTEPSIAVLEAETGRFYKQLHHFADTTCLAFDTHELDREVAARQRAKQRRDKKIASLAPATGKGKGKAQTFPSASVSETSGPKKKQYHLNTVKHHFLPDYPGIIRAFGTTDSYSTEPSELEHRRAKSRYTRTSRKNVESQLARLERRQHRIARIKQKVYGDKKVDDERITLSLEDHYFIGKSENDQVNIGDFLFQNKGDPAIEGFYKKLKTHLLPRVLAKLHDKKDIDRQKLPQAEQCDGDSVISFNKNTMYQHRIMRVNYTTYDVRRDQDLVNGHSAHCNIMVLSQPTEESNTNNVSSYRYARVLSTYHVNVGYNGPGRPDYHELHKMEFLWVRWYDEVGKPETGWAHQRLGRLRFAPVDDDDAFGIVNPDDVLRGCHIIPRFHLNKVHVEGTGHSPLAKDASDWKEYYVNCFVDRDMLMRYHLGLGIGHLYGHSFYADYPPGNTASGITTTAITSSASAPSIREVDMEADREANSNTDSDIDSNFDSDLDLDDGSELDSDDDDFGNGNISDIEESELAAEEMYAQ